jgi:thiosulfate/3-mercaptopyruvate sulfurtransferase
MGKDVWDAHIQQRIPKSVFYDHTEIKDKVLTDFAISVPPLDWFITNMKKLRIPRDVSVVVYDSQGIFSSPRCFEILRYFGHEKVRILNGGFKKWLVEGRPTESGD